MSTTQKLVFSDVNYYLSFTLNETERQNIASILDANGAVAVAFDHPDLTHFVTNSSAADSLENIPPESLANTVTPLWIERSIVLAGQQPAQYYSPEPALLFSGVTAAATDLSPTDLELLSAGITALGGQWRSALTKDITHLFALSTGSAKYEIAMHHKEHTGMCVLVPHWFDDSVRLGIKSMPTEAYEWPEPDVFSSHDNPDALDDVKDPKRFRKLTTEKMILYDTAMLEPDSGGPPLCAQPHNVWNGYRILLGTSLKLSPSQRSAQEADIIREGGVIVKLPTPPSASAQEIADEEARKVALADIYVTRYRAGPAYVKAYRLNKTIGTLPWLWYVRSTGTVSHPTDQLLHYPIPKRAIEGFSSHIITITNYTGRDREYLKKLIAALGAEFTPSMSGKNTVVIAAYISGIKTKKAVSWSIPVVNHLWLEDAFVQWRMPTLVSDKYMCFPPGLNFAERLTERGIARVGWEAGELDKLEKELDDVIDVIESDDDEDGLAPAGTDNSAREVEDTVALKDADGDIEMAGDSSALMDMDMRVDTDMVVASKVGPSKPTSSKFKPKSKVSANTEESRQRDAISSSISPQTPPRKHLKKYSRRIPEANVPPESNLEHGNTPEELPVSAPSRKKRRGLTQVRPAQASSGKGAKLKSDADVHSGKRVTTADEDIEMDEASDHVRMRKPKDVKGKTKDSTSSRKHTTRNDRESDDEEESDKESEPYRHLVKHKTSRSTIAGTEPATPNKSGRTTARTNSQMEIVVPTLASLLRTTPVENKSGAPSSPEHTTPSRVMRIHSLRITANELSAHTSPKRGRPSLVSGKATRPRSPSAEGSPLSSPTPAHKHLRRAKAITPEPGPSRLVGTPVTLTRSPSRRSAASRASQKLRDEIMPDVMNFQKELKKGAVRSVYEKAQGLAKGKERELDVDIPDNEEKKTHTKKRPSAANENAPTSDEDEPEKKKRRTSAVGKKQAKPTADDPIHTGSSKRKKVEIPRAGDDEVRDVTDSRRPERRAKSDGASTATKLNRPNGKNIRIMTTQVSLSDEVSNMLAKMGAKATTKPSECTHLICRSLVRTEKFLCAMAVAPFVLSEKWAVSSATTKTFLPESDYALNDSVSEKKYGFKLSDALDRAKANGGKLFAGKTFYVTSRVPVEFKLLKNVVSAGGGHAVQQMPTVRILQGNENRIVISCPADVATWRPLAENGHPIYNQELILAGAQKQEIDWDSRAYKVEGS